MEVQKFEDASELLGLLRHSPRIFKIHLLVIVVWKKVLLPSSLISLLGISSLLLAGVFKEDLLSVRYS